MNFLSTTVGALENMGLNIFLIPQLGIEGAAYTTLFAECTVVAFLVFSIRDRLKIVDIKYLIRNITKTFIACIPIVVLSHFYKSFTNENSFVGILVFNIMSVILYITLGLYLKNDGISNLVAFIVKRKS